MPEDNTTPLPPLLWWARQIGLGLLSLFFTAFGIYVLILAYHVNDPVGFIMTFFASNLIILISLTFLAGIVIKGYQVYRIKEGE